MGSLVTMTTSDVKILVVWLFIVLQLYHTSYAVQLAFLAAAGLLDISVYIQLRYYDVCKEIMLNVSECDGTCAVVVCS